VSRNFFQLLPLLLAAGCAAPGPGPPIRAPRPAGWFPATGLVTQRAVLTAGGRQFALNGYVALDETRGRRLIVTETFGQVLADVLVKPDGAIFVMRSSRMFSAARISRYMAADLECIFGQVWRADCPVRMPEADHFVVERRWYKLDLRTLETRSSPQSPELFDASHAEKP
jgi:hypothetical protein